MSVPGRAQQNVEAVEDEDTSPGAMREVDRAWRHMYRDLREARASAARAVTLAEASDDPTALAHALFQAAYAAIRQSIPSEATTATQRCRRVFEQLNDPRGIWLADALDALCLRLDGEGDRSLRRLQALAAHPPPDATATDLFVVHVGLSLGYRFSGLLEPALKWHFQAADTARDTQDSLLLASTLCNLGGYHCDLHNHEEGSRLLEEALGLASACLAFRTTAIIALNLSQAYAALGRHHDALRLAETYLTDERYVLSIGGPEPMIPLTLALAYANAGRPEDAQRTFDGVRGDLVRSTQGGGTPHVFWTYVETRIALVSGEPARAVEIAVRVLDDVDDAAVDSPFDLMQLHASAATAAELIDDHRRALRHERSRAVIRERLARLAARVATLTHTIRHELDTTRAERDRVMALHAELELEHRRLATLNRALTAQIAENVRLHDELKEQNFRDVLTGLHNRRYLYERGPRLLEAGIANGTPLCLVMLDLDHFKRLNDAHGHMVGDRVLVAFGKLLRDALREDDVVCRVGGEEFAMVLTTTTAHVAADRLQGMLTAVGHLVAPDGEAELPVGLTFSAGVAEAPALGSTIDALMIAADRLLYKAKNDGRSRIDTGPSLPPGPAARAAREPVDHETRGDEAEDRGHGHH